MGDTQGFQYAQHGHALGAGRIFIDVTGQALKLGKALIGQHVGFFPGHGNKRHLWRFFCFGKYILF